MKFDITHIIFYHSLLVFGEILIIVVFINMIYQRRSSTSIIAWLLFFILVPYVTVIAYLIFGFRKRKNRYVKHDIPLKDSERERQPHNIISKILESYNIFETISNEEFKIYTTPQDAYEIFMSSLTKAQKSIYLETYVLKYDPLSKEIFKILIQKAQAGVKVKILVDTLGSWQLYFNQKPLVSLKEAGIEISFFMPIFQMPFRNYINLRNHRKIYLFDDTKVISGGINLTDEYMGKNENQERWIDLVFLSKGKSAKFFFDIFASDWLYAANEQIDFQPQAQQKEQQGSTTLQIVPSGPDMQKDVLYESLLSAIYASKKRIWIVTPYFVPDSSILLALIIAKHRGVDVKIITPKKSNHFIVDLTRNSYIHELEESDIDVALHNGKMIHAKAILFDDTGTMLGSVNIDNRSLFLNYEVATFVYSPTVTQFVEEWMKTLLSQSSRNTKKVSGIRKIVENLLRIIAPQL
jgi:cardiolipin synthase A/B